MAVGVKVCLKGKPVPEFSALWTSNLVMLILTQRLALAGWFEDVCKTSIYQKLLEEYGNENAKTYGRKLQDVDRWQLGGSR
jgi:hypothetical protein